MEIGGGGGGETGTNYRSDCVAVPLPVLSTVQINPSSHSATGISQSFRFNAKICSRSTLAGGGLFYWGPNWLSAALGSGPGTERSTYGLNRRGRYL